MRRSIRTAVAVAAVVAGSTVATCDVPVPPEFSPDGTANWVFRVIGFFH